MPYEQKCCSQIDNFHYFTINFVDIIIATYPSLAYLMYVCMYYVSVKPYTTVPQYADNYSYLRIYVQEEYNSYVGRLLLSLTRHRSSE